MEIFRSRRTVLMLIIAGGCAIILFLFLAIGPPRLLAKSDSPEFCVSCHVMESEYEAWAHTGAHRRKTCVDCHLPNENARIHYIWKAFDGLKDVAFFYSGAVSDHIDLSAHGAKVLQENCIRCHEQTVMHINQERNCWECHRRVMHTRSGAMQTL